MVKPTFRIPTFLARESSIPPPQLRSRRATIHYTSQLLENLTVHIQHQTEQMQLLNPKLDSLFEILNVSEP